MGKWVVYVNALTHMGGIWANALTHLAKSGEPNWLAAPGKNVYKVREKTLLANQTYVLPHILFGQG